MAATPTTSSGPASTDPASTGGEPSAPGPSAPGPSAPEPSAPDVPSTAYLAQLDEEREAAMRTASHPGSPFAGADAALRDRLEDLVDAGAPETIALLHDLAAHPETAFAEHRSAREIVRLLAAHGIDAQLGVHGLETAIRAELPGAGDRDGADGAGGAGGDGGSGAAAGPTTAILLEYDALPGIGHGCGHNLIAAMGLGAFLALAELAREDPSAVPGRVVLLGTPAEEGRTGKEHMAREGAFDGIDAAVMAHPYPGYDLADQVWLGRRTLTVAFHGRTAHASAQPFMGRNALDAASLMYQGIGLMRQQTPPSDRVHAVIREGGERASVIPDEAVLDLYVRSQRPETLRDLSRRVEDVARGAARMTGCGVDVHWDEDPPSLPVRTNEALTGRWVEAQRRRGRDPLPLGVVSTALAASTDFGNVSVRVPGMHPLIRIAPAETALHTRGFAAAAVSEQAEAAVTDGAYGLAASVLDLLHDPQLAAAVAAEFADAGGALDVPSYFAPDEAPAAEAPADAAASAGAAADTTEDAAEDAAADVALRDRLRALPGFPPALPVLDPATVPADPRELVAAWLDEAIASGARQGHAMTLTTIAEDGAPVGRTLILKDVTEEGYCFSTHASSRKGRQLAADPRASMLFFWRESGRQVRITGEVVALDDATAQRDWEERPTYDGRPNPDWRVYALRPTEIEVMQAREDRRHVRIEYRLVDGGDSGSEGGGAGARWTHGPVATPAG